MSKSLFSPIRNVKTGEWTIGKICHEGLQFEPLSREEIEKLIEEYERLKGNCVTFCQIDEP